MPPLVQPKPTPTTPEPTPEPPPIQPKPEPEPVKPTPEPEKPRPQPDRKESSDTNRAAGMVFATLFILIGVGVPIAFLVYRFIISEPDDDEMEDDDPHESTNPLDR